MSDKLFTESDHKKILYKIYSLLRYHPAKFQELYSDISIIKTYVLAFMNEKFEEYELAKDILKMFTNPDTFSLVNESAFYDISRDDTHRFFKKECNFFYLLRRTFHSDEEIEIYTELKPSKYLPKGSISFSLTYQVPNSEIRNIHLVHYKSKFYRRFSDNKLREPFDSISDYIDSMLGSYKEKYGIFIKPITRDILCIEK